MKGLIITSIVSKVYPYHIASGNLVMKSILLMPMDLYMLAPLAGSYIIIDVILY
jgi:hypothetical protein